MPKPTLKTIFDLDTAYALGHAISSLNAIYKKAKRGEPIVQADVDDAKDAVKAFVDSLYV